MAALQMCSVLMDRLPVVFQHSLLREGVIHSIHRMRTIQGAQEMFGCDHDQAGMLSECASQFWSTHVLPSLPTTNSENVSKTINLSKLLTLAEQLLEFGVLGSKPGSDATSLLSEILLLLVSGDGVSVFEFQGSGLTPALLSYLDPMHQDLCSRIECLLQSALLIPTELGSHEGNASPFCVLVKLLSGSVSKTEQFHVMLHSSVTNLGMGLKVLTQPFKLCLKRDKPAAGNNSSSSSGALQDYSSNVVLIEPLATVTAVEEFLWSKVRELEHEEPDEDQPSVPRGERLSLRMNGVLLNHKSTIFQAIYESGQAQDDAEEYKISSKVWEQVHVITYSPHEPSMHPVSTMSPQLLRLASHGSCVEVQTRPSGLAAQVLNRLSDSFTQQWGENELGSTLHLLATLNWISNNWQLFVTRKVFETVAPGGVAGSLLPPGHFISAKLTNKLMRQLQDPLVLCSGGLPAWCRELVSAAGYVLPFECRRLFFQYTSLGISRALHIMQHRAEQAENGHSSPLHRAGSNGSHSNSEFRLGRIQRQKARVHRANLLGSATKVLELCAGHKAILEVEFTGEAGTGTGPTLEFFTLVSREIQRRDLGIWYESEASKAAPPDPEAETVYSPPQEMVRMENAHLVAVLHCSQCNHTTFPTSPDTGELLSVPTENGSSAAASHDPELTLCSGGGSCDACDCSDSLQLLWWVVFDDEALYLSKAFPPGVAVLQHMVLQCPSCRSVNFPGTEHTLTLNQNGKMFSVSGRRFHEHEYRAVTQHASSLCENGPLDQVAVALTQQVVDGMVAALRVTPELLENSTQQQESGASTVEYVTVGQGLFPSPLTEEHQTEQLHNLWIFLGRFVAKAVMDGRLIDLPFNPTFWKAILMRELSLTDLGTVDPQLCQSLQAMRRVAAEYEAASKIGHQSEREAAIEAVTLDGAKIEDLCLDFTLPGRPEIELVPNGTEVPVTAENIGDYVARVAQHMLHDGVVWQIEAFRRGFMEIVPLDGFLNFNEQEIDSLVCGDSSFWDPKSFVEQIKCDRGFTSESPAISFLAEILDEMSIVHKRLFLRFATGSPKLPVDGLRGLNPPLTVVLKPPDNGSTPDDYLPSVMTCTNYLKLPNYSTKEIMKDKLMTAIKEGHLSFHLS
eukprot:TRINITY_DN9915_c0_g1_i4.p1 TRINITY_DN9915_c0_g1~~TRINITY_DN9915_c0_g1_i4.p1  ORF type:complete len:1131 (+),score=303.45 TRINITY_DN9915_c0_g1_i4:245-3637(+)